MSKSPYFKFLSLFLIITVIGLIYPNQAEAGFVVNSFKFVISAINYVINLVLALSEITIGSVLGINFLSADGSCRLSNLTKTIFNTYAGECEGTPGIVLISAQPAQGIGCAFQVPMAFYNKEMNANYKEVPIYKDTPQGKRDYGEKGCEKQLNFNETNRKIAIYRFTLSADSSNESLSNWFLGLKNNAGNGFLKMALIIVRTGAFTFKQPTVNDLYHQAGDSVSSRILEMDYKKLCGDTDTCNFTDATAPENSYIAYAAKILGDYSGHYDNGCPPGSESCVSINACINGQNKFLHVDPSSLPEAIIPIKGPFKTGNCPKLPTVSFAADPSTIKQGESSNLTWTSTDADSCSIDQGIGKIDISGSRRVSPSNTTSYVLTCISSEGGSTSKSATITVIPRPTISFQVSSPPVELPDSIYLGWQTTNADSCSGSGDWSGSKSIPNGSEYLYKPRGDYSFTLTCSGPGGSVSETRTTRVIQIPRCTFAADPTSIILPQTSTLSWSCAYADTCSIDQGVGSVNPISGSQEVRPSATTTYTLTCDSLDGTRTWQSTVNVGFTPRLREVAP